MDAGGGGGGGHSTSPLPPSLGLGSPVINGSTGTSITSTTIMATSPPPATNATSNASSPTGGGEGGPPGGASPVGPMGLGVLPGSPGLGPTRHVYTNAGGGSVEIREVWEDNLDEEMAMIREVVEQYPFIAMDTEFPGVVARPVGDVTAGDYQYKTLKCNVDLLKIIQLGLSFANEKGLGPQAATWQFNFRFSLNEDMYAQDSIELLKASGIDFGKHERHGIDVHRFGELMMTSGLVLMDNIKWISFHSGYDFGYLMKILTCQSLPSDENQFFDLLRTFFPTYYDIKYLITACNGMHGGLQKIAEDLYVERIGPMHQAGSDSLLTAQTFFKLCETSFKGVNNLDENKFRNELFGLGNNHTVFRTKNPPGNPAMMNGGGAPQFHGMQMIGGRGGTDASTAYGVPGMRGEAPSQQRQGPPGMPIGGPSPASLLSSPPPPPPPGTENMLVPEQYGGGH